jgi:hypothetical protein
MTPLARLRARLLNDRHDETPYPADDPRSTRNVEHDAYRRGWNSAMAHATDIVESELCTITSASSKPRVGHREASPATGDARPPTRAADTSLNDRDRVIAALEELRDAEVVTRAPYGVACEFEMPMGDA